MTKKFDDNWSSEKMGMAFMAAVSTLFYIYIFIRIQLSERQFISLSYFPLVLGLIYESKKVAVEWKHIVTTLIWSSFLSIIVFIPGEGISYNFEDRITIYSYAVIVIYIVITISTNAEKVTPQLSEESSLLLSVAAFYWLISDVDLYKLALSRKLFLGLAIIYLAYALYHAFTKTTLSFLHRFYLSLGSSVIILLFAVDNIYRIYSSTSSPEEYLVLYFLEFFLQYFLLGISSVYMAQNLKMLVGFLPDKNRFFNSEYFSDIRKLKFEHVKRYSEQQLNSKAALICLIFMSAIFVSNHLFNIVAKNIAIWIVFVTIPLLNIKVFKTTANSG